MPAYDWETSSKYSLNSSTYTKVEQAPAGSEHNTNAGLRARSKSEPGVWRMRVAKLSIAPLILLLAALTIAVIVTGSGSSSDAFGCDANGNSWYGTEHRPSIWNSRYALSITLRFGNLTYPQAKAIDIIWDLMVGRTSQIIAMLMTYRIFRRVMSRDMQNQSVPFSKYLSMQYNTVSFKGLLAYTKEVDWLWFWKRRSTRDFLTGIALILSTVYTMLLPVWLSSMTGYQAYTHSTLNTPDGISASPADLQLCQYTISDGNRIGLWLNYCATKNSSWVGAIANYATNYIGVDGFTPTDRSPLSQINIGAHGYTLPPPLLNITSADQSATPTYLLQSANQTFTSAELSKVGACVPQANYQWGFSITLLTAFLVTTCVLATWLYVVWLSTFGDDDEDPNKTFGELTSALQVASAIHQELGATADLTERELRLALKRRGNLGIPARQYRGPRDYVAKSSTAVHITALAPEDRPPTYSGRGMY